MPANARLFTKNKIATVSVRTFANAYRCSMELLFVPYKITTELSLFEPRSLYDVARLCMCALGLRRPNSEDQKLTALW